MTIDAIDPDAAELLRRLTALETRLGPIRSRPRYGEVSASPPTSQIDPGAAEARLRSVEYRLQIMRGGKQ